MNRWAFLWITDLHFASPDSNYSDDPKDLDRTEDGEFRDGIFRDSIVNDFHELLDFDFRDLAGKDFAESLSFIALGGDITTHGRQRRSIYKNIEPYGVLNIGSPLEGCPVGRLALPSLAPLLLRFQHRISRTLAKELPESPKATSAGKAQ